MYGLGVTALDCYTFTPRKACSPHSLLHVTTDLGDVSIQPVVFSLQKLLLDQTINIPLDTADFQRTPIPCRLDGLTNQLGVTDPFPRLQNPDDGGLRLIVAVGRNPFVGLFVLSRGLLQLNGVDLDAVFGVGERSIDSECIGFVDLAAFRVLCEGPYFGTGK